MSKTKVKESLELTQDYLKSILHYDPITGIFTRKTKSAQRVKIGDIAGCVDVSDGYHKIKINHKKYKSHRLAWLYVKGEFPKYLIDHKNRIRHDNRFCNLRECTDAQNAQNRPSDKNTSSKYVGVSYRKDTNKWKAQITVNGNTKNLGQFSLEKDAYDAYLKAKEIYHPFAMQ